MSEVQLYNKITSLPEDLKKQVADFVEFLETKSQTKVEKKERKFGYAKGFFKMSEGSDWIIKILEEDDERPLWISTWGGVNTLAQALYKLENTKIMAPWKRFTRIGNGLSKVIHRRSCMYIPMALMILKRLIRAAGVVDLALPRKPAFEACLKLPK
jgi:hypothetical protein